MRKSLYLLLNSVRGYPVARYYREFRSEDSPESVTRRLRSILTHCREHVPYYAKTMADCSQPWLVDPRGYLPTMPVLTKAVIRENWNALHSAPRRRGVFENTSGGSTGEPIRLLQDRDYSARVIAANALACEEFGKCMAQCEVRLWGSERDVMLTRKGWEASIRSVVKNSTTLNAFRMNPDRMRHYAAEINRLRPVLLEAYSQSAYELARFVEAERLCIHPPAAIVTSAGMLYPFMRATIERAFRAPVFNRYGSREVGIIACQCRERDALHVSPWTIYLEVVDDHGKPVASGVEGRILVTSLANFTMPLIRYDIGDRGILARDGACRCGRKGQQLAALNGRTVDCFVAEDGSLIDGEYFTHLLYFRHWAIRFQIVQRIDGRIEYRVVNGGINPDETELKEIVRQTRTVIGDRPVEFHFVPDIDNSPSGKHRYTISEMVRS